ncbi:unnamed protein product, partial [Polarella glacialis]
MHVLVEARCGIARSPWTPAAWSGHVWKGTGTPDPLLTDSLLSLVRCGGRLPTGEQLAASPDLEASAARALDLFDDYRIPGLLHADDPILFASSKGELRRVIGIVQQWCTLYKATFHCSESKTVLFAIGPQPSVNMLYQGSTLYFVQRPGQLPKPLMWSKRHKWLGVLWSSDLDFLPQAQARVAACGSIMSTLFGLLEGGVVPLALGDVLFTLKVESVMRFGRWLWGLDARVRLFLDAAYESWAKGFLAADHWRSSAVARGEIGWILSGSARCVLDVACRRASFWRHAHDTLAGGIFFRSHAIPGPTWASLSAALLSEWGLLDLPEWLLTRSGADTSVRDYTVYCKTVLYDRCLTTWLSDVASHKAPVYYSAPGPAGMTMLVAGLPWEVLVGYRSLCRFRAGLLVLGHKDGKRCQAAVRACIFCNLLSPDLWLHVLCCCPVFL